MSTVRNYRHYDCPPIGIVNCAKFCANERRFRSNFGNKTHSCQSNFHSRNNRKL